MDDKSSFLKELAKSLPDYRANNNSVGGVHTIEWIREDEGYSLRAVRKAELVAFLKTATVPDDHIVSFEEYVRRDPQTGGKTATYWRAYYIFRKIEVGGTHISDAYITTSDGTDGSPPKTHYVSIELNAEGAKVFAQLTTDHVNERLAILFDDQVLTAATIREQITGGRVQLSMGNAMSRADQARLARTIQTSLLNGAYAAPVREVEVKKGGAKP